MENRKFHEDISEYLRKILFEDVEYITKDIEDFKLHAPQSIGILHTQRACVSNFTMRLYRAQIISSDECESIISVVDPEFYRILMNEKRLLKEIKEKKNAAALQRKED